MKMIGRHPIIGPRTAIVDSSRIDMLAGLSKAGNRRMPHGFCERAGPQTERLATNPIASLSAPRFAFIRLRYMWLMIITHSVSNRTRSV